MREQEKNEFDAICVAGDIGNRFVDEIFGILATFNCPIYFVYGNMESSLCFDRAFNKSCISVHHKVFENNGYYITGFNGCSQGWGQNPIRSELYRKVADRFPDLTKAIKMVHKVRDEIYLNANKKYQIEFKNLNSKYEDKRSQEFREGLLSLGEKRYNDYQKYEATSSRLEMDRLEKTQQYKKYAVLMGKATEDFIIKNRNLMFKAIQKSNAPSNKVVIMTHERQYRMHEQLVGIKCHIFGHHHGFKHTVYKGTNFVNVSSLDPDRSRTYQDHNGVVKGPDDYWAKDYRDVKYLLGTYGVIELSGDRVSVTRRLLHFEYTI